MAAFGSAVRRLSRRGVFQAVRAFSLGPTSRTSVAVVSAIIFKILKVFNSMSVCHCFLLVHYTQSLNSEHKF